MSLNLRVFAAAAFVAVATPRPAVLPALRC